MLCRRRRTRMAVVESAFHFALLSRRSHGTPRPPTSACRLPKLRRSEPRRGMGRSPRPVLRRYSRWKSKSPRRSQGLQQSSASWRVSSRVFPFSELCRTSFLRFSRSSVRLELGEAAIAGTGLVDGKANPANISGWKRDHGCGFAVILQMADGDRGAAVAKSQSAGTHAGLNVWPVVQRNLVGFIFLISKRRRYSTSESAREDARVLGRHRNQTRVAR